MEIEQSGLDLDPRPLDASPRGTAVYGSRILRLHDHEASLVFREPGTATVRIHGRRSPGDEAITATRTITAE